MRFWLHAEHLSVDSQKMSKSLGNIYTLRDLKERGFAPEALRYLLASVPYRKKLNFTFDGLKAAATSIDRLRNYKLRLETDKFPDGTNAALAARTQAARAAFDAALDDDLNTAEALGTVFEYVRDTNTAMDAGEFPAGNVTAALEFLERFDSVFDVLKPTAHAGGLSDAEVDALIAERTAAKKAKNFGRSDEIRARTGRPRRNPRRHQGRSTLETVMKIESKTVHWGDRRKAGNFTPVTTPIYTAASYVYESMEQLDRVFALEESGPSYARYDNPTRSALEELVRGA